MILGKAGNRSGRAGDVDLARNVGRATGAADGEGNGVQSGRAKGMLGANFGTGIAVAEVPANRVDRPARLVDELNGERHIAGRLILREGSNRAGDVLGRRWNRRIGAILDVDIV